MRGEMGVGVAAYWTWTRFIASVKSFQTSGGNSSAVSAIRLIAIRLALLQMAPRSAGEMPLTRSARSSTESPSTSWTPSKCLLSNCR